MNCDCSCCHLLWYHSSVFQFSPCLLTQTTTLPHGASRQKITMDHFNDFCIILYIVKFDCGIHMDFISLFCTTFPITIVLVLAILTWTSLNDTNKRGHPSARFASKPRRSRHHGTAVSTSKNDVTYTADAFLHVPVSSELCNKIV